MSDKKRPSASERKHQRRQRRIHAKARLKLSYDTVHFDTLEGWDLVLDSDVANKRDHNQQTRDNLIRALSSTGRLPPGGEYHTLQELMYYLSLLCGSDSSYDIDRCVNFEGDDACSQASTHGLDDNAGIGEESHRNPSLLFSEKRSRPAGSLMARTSAQGETRTLYQGQLPPARVSVKGRQRGTRLSNARLLESLTVDVLHTICTHMKARSILRLGSASSYLHQTISNSPVWRTLYTLHSPAAVPPILLSSTVSPTIWRGLYRALFLDNVRDRSCGTATYGGWKLRECACPIDGCGAVLHAPDLEPHVTRHFSAANEIADNCSDGEAASRSCRHCTCSTPCQAAVNLHDWQCLGWDAEEALEELERARASKKWCKLLPATSMLPECKPKARGRERTGKKWRSVVQVGGVKVILGAFSHKEHAALVYDVAKRLLQPQCAQLAGLNYPMCVPPSRVSAAVQRLINARLAVNGLCPDYSGARNKSRDTPNFLNEFD